MKTKELVEILRFCSDKEICCSQCKLFDLGREGAECIAELLNMAADALDARNAGDALLPAWMSVKFCLPPMHTDVFEDEGEPVEYQISDTVLAYTIDGQIVTARAAVEMGTTWCFDDNGAEYEVTHWMPVKPPKEVPNVQRNED